MAGEDDGKERRKAADRKTELRTRADCGLLPVPSEEVTR